MVSSKEVLIIFLEIFIAIILGFLFNVFDLKFLWEMFKEYLPMMVTIIIVLIGLVIIIYRKIREISEELEEYKENQNNLERSLKRAEDLINLKAENKYIKDKVLSLEKRMLEYGNKK